MTSSELSYLLDKSVARRLIESLYHLDDLTADEELVLALWRQLRLQRTRLFVPSGVIHILGRFNHLAEVQAFLGAVEPLEPGRYFKRWARRLREHGFTREDACILSLATFGFDPSSGSLGVSGLITLDRPFINNFEQQRQELQRRLASMVSQLPSPYKQATLPVLWHPLALLIKMLQEEDSVDEPMERK